MKIAEIDTDDLPIWMCAVVDTVSENCKKRLKTSPQYSRIVEESDKLLSQYPFISTLIDRDKIETPMNLTLEQTKALSRFLALDADREDYCPDFSHWTQTGKIMNGYSFISWDVSIP